MSDLPVLVSFLAAAVSLGTIAGSLVVMGRRQQALTDLATRHGELAKEARERLSALEGRVNGHGEKLARAETSLEVLGAGE